MVSDTIFCFPKRKYKKIIITKRKFVNYCRCFMLISSKYDELTRFIVPKHQATTQNTRHDSGKFD